MTASARRYVSAGVPPGRCTASSASRANGSCASGSEYTATVAISMERAVRKIREAISPRLATSSFLITGPSPSHPEDAEAAASLDWPRVDGRQSDPQHGAGVTRVDDAVVVQAGADEEGVRFALDLRLDLLPPLLVGFGVVLAPGGLRRGPADDRQHAGELLRAHDGQLGVGPGEHQPRVVGAAGHAVVARAERRRPGDREGGGGR